MHEAAAIQGALNEALAKMHTAGGTRMTRLVLVLGASSHFTEEIARQHFAVDAQGTPAEAAILDIEWLPALYTCLQCLHTFSSAEPGETVTCPACGGTALEIDHADICYVREIEVECNENHEAMSQFTVPTSMNMSGEQT